MAESRYTLQEYYDALSQTKGNISACARLLNMRRSSLKERIDASPELRAKLEEVREEMLDKAEENVYDRVEQGDDAMTRFVLSTLGKERGYTQKTEVDNKHSFVGQGAVDRIMAGRERARNEAPPNSDPKPNVP